MTRLADFAVRTLTELGISQAFLVTGGAAMHLNDALAAEERIRVVCHHHEQAAAYAAEGYGHMTGCPALLMVTAGPGAINAMSGVFGAYVDSIPMVVLSGQSKTELLRSTYAFEHMRQLGEQEADIISMVRPIAKYARRITRPERIGFELQKAFHEAVSGRPGPVWLEIPLDIQSLDINPESLPAFHPCRISEALSHGDAAAIVEQLENAARPLLVIGPDISAQLHSRVRLLAEQIGCPVVGAGAEDTILNDHPLFAGRLGTLGTRAGNIAVQNADLILFLGMRSHLGLVTFNWKEMGRNAHKIVFDDDPNEFEKPCSLADEAYCCSQESGVEALIRQTTGFPEDRWQEWKAWCKRCREALPPLRSSMRGCSEDGRINPYWFTEELIRRLNADDCIVMGNASSSIVPLQAGFFRCAQRLFSNHGNGAMGFALPAAIGASMGSAAGRVICLEGDGSIMMNIQELQTITHHQLPILVFVFNNNGYASIRQTQQNFFGRELGAGPHSGVSFPDFVRVAESFGLPSFRLAGDDFGARLDILLQQKGPLLVDVILDPTQPFEPKVASRRLPDGTMCSSSPENMSPFLEPEELKTYLISG